MWTWARSFFGDMRSGFQEKSFFTCVHMPVCPPLNSHIGAALYFLRFLIKGRGAGGRDELALCWHGTVCHRDYANLLQGLV